MNIYSSTTYKLQEQQKRIIVNQRDRVERCRWKSADGEYCNNIFYTITPNAKYCEKHRIPAKRLATKKWGNSRKSDKIRR